MAIKAVFFDIDGTLLNDRKNVQKSTIKAIRNLKDQGILVGLATGRGPSFVQPFLENLGLDFAVTYNGQYIYSRSEIIYTNQLSKTTVYRLIRYAGARRREISLGTASGLLGSGIIGLGTSRLGQIVSSLVPRKWAKAIERSFKHFIRRIKPQNIDSLMVILREPIYQVVLVATEGESERIQKQFPRVKLTRSSPYSMDVISEGQSKVKGIERVGQCYGFDLSEVIAFGDSDNDIEMLSQVGIGVAMGNASQQVKENARYTTADNNDDGISKALAHYGLIQFEIEKTFSSRDENFNKVKSFHLLMDGETIKTPRLYDSKEAGFRSDFKVEEIVEFLYAASQGNQEVFDQSIRNLHLAIDKARDKVISKDHPETPLVGEVDALTDLLYLTYGSFVLMGVDPKPLFDTVHEANMGKIFPDGKAHFDPVTHKILKPDDWEEHFAPEPSIRRELDSQIQKSLNRK
ncbi:TPA: HAD-IIB family hydrolase [Streptococcus agalactiae]|uniref:HAD-IIB family hydrolase n=1 Tax=Streptococcus agalactiae TaxID=1311 RepID=UPI0002BA1726|nr:HAD-IIB family hydrolase [Streptococcus agalactiae]EPU76515.1 haloacid dehalogenase [Streptococcus agalactiae GB00115]HEN2245401.1 HAD-IIB family hydrolase [Streptococcus agalactiae]HEN3160329.1 HAD-IIB family hydrolase [Streptococcus agalactiae]HEN3166560.1 HAD-IIB family hydrolase [Streptococcus agalactiae]HEN3213229.1 HAD-IIB family hydrolase [Streptococcus agalactiae]